MPLVRLTIVGPILGMGCGALALAVDQGSRKPVQYKNFGGSSGINATLRARLSFPLIVLPVLLGVAISLPSGRLGDTLDSSY